MNPGLILLPAIAALLSSCQAHHVPTRPDAAESSIPPSAVSAIAGDMAARLAEQVGEGSTRSFSVSPDESDYGIALRAALTGFGFEVGSGKASAPGAKPVVLAYAFEPLDGQVLAQISTPEVGLARVYSLSGPAVLPASPLSVRRHQ